MNVTINRAELLSAAQKAAAIASENAPLEPLKGALLEADPAANTLTITATNLETSLELKLACTAGDDDALVVNAKLLAGMLERLPGEMVELKRQPGVSAISLRSDGAGYDVTIWERGNFPKVQIPFPEDTVKVSGIPSMAHQTTFATVEDKDRPLLRCVNLMFTQEGLKAVGSDGGCVVTAKGDDKSTGNANLLLPANSLEKLAALCGDKDEFQVGTAGKFIVFMRQGLKFSALLMEGDYVDAGRIMDSIRNQFTVLTDVAELRRALKTVSAVDPKGRVKLAFDSGQITFSCKGELGTASESVDIAPLTGAPQGSFWYLMLCVVKDERLTPDTPTYRYPFSNLHSDKSICTGNNALPLYKNPARLHTLASYLLRLPNNNDLYSKDNNRLHAEYRDLLEQMKGKTPSHYYTDVLIEDGRTLKDFLNGR